MVMAVASANKIITLFSSFIMELNNVESADEIFDALVRIVRKTVSAKWVVITDENKNILKGYPKDLDVDVDKFSELADWALSNRTHSFYPVEDEIVGFLPMVRGDSVLGMIIVGLEEEPKVEEIDSMRVFSFLSATVAENVRLLEEV